MDFFILNAWADGATSSTGSALASFIPLIFLFVVFYFLLIRPQTKRAKEHQQMINALAKGDEVVVNGLLGKITELGDNYIKLEIAPNMEIKAQRQAVIQVLPKGTLKTL